MTVNLPTTLTAAKSALNAIKAVGPLLIAQWDKASEAHARHQTRLAQVEAYKEFLVAEGRNLADIHKLYLQRYFDATDEDKVRLRSDIENVEREMRRLGVIQNSLTYLPKGNVDESTASDGQAPAVVEPAWLDRFNEYAKAQNEAWRQDLLSRALAKESSMPGSIGPRALWFIGTIEEVNFHALASLIDISSFILAYCVPNHTHFYAREIPACVLGPKTTLGNITFLLSSLGLFGDLHSSLRVLQTGTETQIRYGNSAYILRVRREFRVSGVILTPLGDIIASLYEPKPNSLGQEIFDEWIKSLSREVAEVIPITDAT